MSAAVPSPYQNVPLAQRPPGRRGRGQKHIPAGIKESAQAEVLSGVHQALVARRYGVSRDLVKRLAETAVDVNPEHVQIIRKGLSAKFVVATDLALNETIQSLQEGDHQAATRSMFTAKLGTEGNRWVQAGAANPQTTLKTFLEALHQAGGGSLTVNGPDADAPEAGDAVVIDVTPEPVEASDPMSG